MLKKLHLKNVGPSDELTLHLKPRLNLIRSIAAGVVNAKIASSIPADVRYRSRQDILVKNHRATRGFGARPSSATVRAPSLAIRAILPNDLSCRCRRGR